MITRTNKTLTGESGAMLSNCEQYRYRLWRVCDSRLPSICILIRLNTQQAAEFLNVGKREIYNMAFPRGPIPVHKLGKRLTRFAVTNLKACVISCRYDAFEIKSVSVSNSKRRSMDSGSVLQNFFVWPGLKSKLTSSTKPNQSGSRSLSDSDRLTSVNARHSRRAIHFSRT